MVFSQNVGDTIATTLPKHGFQVRFVAVEHLDDLRREYEKTCAPDTTFDQNVYQAYLKYLDFEVPSSLPNATALIIATAPSPIQKVSFTLSGKTVTYSIPPTYDQNTDSQIKDLLSGILHPQGYHLVRAALPEKLLAVHSGLAKYGKNNITYVEGMGSYHRPVTYYTDAPVRRTDWVELKVLDECSSCIGCIQKCPTGAIKSDRFLIYAEKCLTFHNEQPEPFPDWIEQIWHNCLVGCLHCQTICPLNKSVRDWAVSSVTFSEVETKFILRGDNSRDYPPGLAEKLHDIFFQDELNLFTRNVKALLLATGGQ